jgi:hypothetical protein
MSTIRPALPHEVTPELLERTEKSREELRHVASRYGHGILRHIPFLGRIIVRVEKANMYEKTFAVLPCGDTVVDEKLAKAIKSRGEEWSFHLWTGLAFSAWTFLQSGWKRFGLAPRLAVSAIPLAVATYRGHRRGVDLVNYVGDTFMEIHFRRSQLIKYLRDYDDYLPEFKDHLVKSGLMDLYLSMYGLHRQTGVEA